MALSNDLISQFVKLTNDSNKTTNNETTMYGTAVLSDGSFYIQFDGSDQLTPMTTTVDIKDGDRVTAIIKDHQVIVTGNTTSPAARLESVNELDGKVVTVETKINQTNDKIALKVTMEEVNTALAGYYTKAEADAEITVSAEGILSTVEETYSTKTETGEADLELETQISAIKQTSESLQISFGDIQTELKNNGSTIDDLQSKVTNISSTAERIEITSFNDQPCIALTESDSEYKLLITNTEILFVKGDTVINTINAEGNTTRNNIVEGEIKQGGFAWVVHGSGNLGLVWKGE